MILLVCVFLYCLGCSSKGLGLSSKPCRGNSFVVGLYDRLSRVLPFVGVLLVY